MMRIYEYDEDGNEVEYNEPEFMSIESGIKIILDEYLEEYSLEDFLDEFDLRAEDAILALYENGSITDRDLEKFLLEV